MLGYVKTKICFPAAEVNDLCDRKKVSKVYISAKLPALPVLTSHCCNIGCSIVSCRTRLTLSAMYVSSQWCSTLAVRTISCEFLMSQFLFQSSQSQFALFPASFDFSYFILA